MMTDDMSVLLSGAILKGSGQEAAARALETMTRGGASLDAVLAERDRAAQQEGLPLVAAVLVPVLIEATRSFWKAYATRIIERVAKYAGDVTVDTFRAWFLDADEDEQQRLSDALVEKIRKAGAERGLKADDIDALIDAAQPDRLAESLADA
ncbi:hypothetical protein [Acuticoccus sediminis]|uniref:hypothetical protein n=1 Tax=Acuticoccus sediminis TaxID=2184697 RepID=UPI001CFE85D7|nr:hypothetical protein [Acuticoccus sediminis]